MPEVPDERLAAGDWTLAEETTETLFGLPTVQVTGHTRLYEDATLREDVRAATDGDLDMPWRFFFATRLSFRPPLVPTIGPAMVLPSVATESRRAFADDLKARGFRAVSRGRTQRTRTGTGKRLRLTKYTARYGVKWRGREHAIDIEGWLGLWLREGEFRLAGGAYSTRGFDALLTSLELDRETDPRDDREELLALIRAGE